MGAMDRRSFLKRFTAAAAVGTAAIVAGVELDPEKLLWVPGAKTFFLPPEKKIVVDAAAIEREYATLTKAAAEGRAADIVAGHVAHRVHTGMGLVESDAAWNVIRIAGRPVSAREAARARLSHFQQMGTVRGGPQAVQMMTEQIIAERMTAGWSDPVGPVSPRERERIDGDWVGGW